MRVSTHEIVKAAFAATAIATGTLAVAASPPAAGPVSDASRLISIRHLPFEGDMCAWAPPAAPDVESSNPDGRDGTFSDDELAALTAFRNGRPGAFLAASLGPPGLLTSLHQGNLYAALRQVTSGAPVAGGSERTLTPLRTIRDAHPTYSAIALDLNSSEVVLQDNNLWSFRVFNRLDNTPRGAEMTPPKRLVQGDRTAIQFNNGLYVDPKNSDIYSVESDVGDKMVVFSREADGNVPPKRILNTPHRVYNVAVDETRGELFVTVEYPPEVVVYRKDAAGDEQPIRRIQGDHTGLDAPHGIVVDEQHQLLYVNTWGHHSNFRIPGTGRFYPPAIKVYPLDASGDTAPLRVITGDRTLLNWPAAMKLNPENGDLYVANDIGQSVLVFRNAASAQGNMAPARVLKGTNTRLRYPTGIALDLNNRELWVSNLGNASATVYPLTATGDVPPLRIIRSAPEGKRSLNFGRTAAVAYDSKREQLLVPN